MIEKMRRKLEAAGWRTGSASAFLELTDAEVAAIETELDAERERQRSCESGWSRVRSDQGT